MNNNNITIDAIPPEYLAILEGKYESLIAGAATDADILTILDDMIERTKSGMVWDETGGEQFISVNQANYWDESQISTEVDLHGNKTGEPSKAMQIVSLVLVAVVIVGVLYWLLFARNKEDAEPPITDIDPAATVDAENNAPAVLAIGDELGVQVEIGQPASLEIRFPDKDRGTTFTVVNAPVDDRKLPVLDAMRSGEPVAEWVEGTVINQIYGLPPAWIDSLNPGSEVLVRTDTGGVYHFICLSKTGISGQETELFVQDRPGATFFPLPSYADPIPVIWCPYDPEFERDFVAGGITSSMNNVLDVGNVQITVDDWYVNETLDGKLQLDVLGRIKAVEGSYGSVVLGLNTPTGKYTPEGEQYQANEQESTWLARFNLPASVVIGSDVQLEIRSPLGGSSIVELGTIPNLSNFVDVDVSNDISWNPLNRTILVNVSVTNTHPNSQVVVDSSDFQAHQGGGVVGIRVLDNVLPYPLLAGERKLFSVEVTPVSENSINLSILNSVWELSGVPINP